MSSNYIIICILVSTAYGSCFNQMEKLHMIDYVHFYYHSPWNCHVIVYIYKPTCFFCTLTYGVYYETHMRNGNFLNGF